MKKLLVPTCALAISGVAFAQSSFVFTPSMQSIASGSGTFTVTLSLQTTVTTLSAFDVFLGSNSAGANAFSIVGHTDLVGGGTAAGNVPNPDAFAVPTNPSNPVNYFTFEQYDPDATGANAARSTADLGFAYSSDVTVNGSINLETITIAYNNAPAGTYVFSTTPTGAAGSYHSYFYSNDLGTLNQASQGTFTIGPLPSAPEPATLSLVGLGGLGVLGMTILRRRRA